MLTYEFDGSHKTRKLYEEAFYIMAYYSAFMKNPHKKTHSILKTLMGVIIYAGVVLATGILFLFVDYSLILATVLLTVGALVGLLFLKYYLAYKKRVDISMKDTSHKVYTISDERIIYKDNGKDLSTEWADIKSIIINKYTVCFLPATLNSTFYVLPVENADEIKTFMSGIGKDGLIVDNR